LSHFDDDEDPITDEIELRDHTQSPGPLGGDDLDTKIEAWVSEGSRITDQN
jgi:hypothetical protein